MVISKFVILIDILEKKLRLSYRRYVRYNK